MLKRETWKPNGVYSHVEIIFYLDVFFIIFVYG